MAENAAVAKMVLTLERISRACRLRPLPWQSLPNSNSFSNAASTISSTVELLSSILLSEAMAEMVVDAGAGANVEDDVDDEDAVEDDEDAAVEDEDDAEEDANPRTRSTRALTIWRIWNGWSVMTQL